MPRYQTYGQYDTKTDEFPDSAEKVLRANEDAASEVNLDGDAGGSDEKRKDAGGLGEDQKDSFYSTARVANRREGFYQGSSFATALNGTHGKSRGGSFMKRRAPLIAIVAVIGGMMVGIGFSQVMMPFHIIETFTEMTDTAFATRAARMPKLVKTVFNLEGSDYAETTRGLFGGKTTRYRRDITSKNVMNRLEAEGITVNKASGVGETTLTYHRSDGVDVEVKAEDYSRLYSTDAEFRNKMNRGGRSFLGRIAAHIDLTLANFLNSHDLTKNLFKGWINKVYDAEGQTARLHELIEQRKLPSAGDVESSTARKDGDVVEEDAEPTKMNKNADSESLGKNYTEAISKIASVTTSAVCGTAAVASMVTAAKLVVAYNNARLGWSSFGEMGDKTRAGYGEAAPLGTKMEQIMKRDENGKTAMDAEQVKWAISGGNYRVNQNAEDVSAFSAGAIKKDNNFINDILEFFGIGLGGSSFLGDVGMSTKWVIGCAAANIATATVSVVLDIMTLGTFSIGKTVLAATIGAGIGLGFSRLAQMLVTNAKSDFCNDPEVVGVRLGACMYLGASNYNGINAQNGGAALVTKEKAAEAYANYKVALAEEAELVRSTKSPFDTSSTHTFLGSLMSKLAMLAIDMPSLTAAASTLTNLASMAATSLLPTASAIDQSLIFENELRTDCSNLDFGGGVIAVGYADCEAWFTTDQSMNNIDPEETFAFLSEYMSVNKTGVRDIPQFMRNNDGTLMLDENGNEKINPESDLGKYIAYCTYRNSSFGQVDQNIMDAESQFLGLSDDGGTLISSILSSLPIIGDTIDMFTAAKQIATLGWSTGANCVARSGTDETMEVTVDMDENGDYVEGATQTFSIPVISWEGFMKYAQSYVADARYMETMGDPNYVSPVLTYARENGLAEPDSSMSFVEYLAKYSGYTVENMQIALNELEYWAYIAQYEPEGKGPMKFSEPVDEVYDFTMPGREIYDGYDTRVALVGRRIVYADLRNRDLKMA